MFEFEKSLPLALLLAGVVGRETPAQIERLTAGATSWERPMADDKGRSLLYRNGTTIYLHDVKRVVANVVAVDVLDAFLSSSGKHVVFTSSGNPVGGNVDGNEEVFLVDLKKGTTVQVTNTTGEDNERPSVDGKGRMIAFVSSADHVGSNPDGGPELYVLDVKKGILSQATNGPLDLSIDDPVMEATGKFVWFASDGDFRGTNADRNDEIFRYDVRRAELWQYTRTTTGDCEAPRPDPRGKFVVFASSSDQLSGANPDGNQDVYRLDVKAATFLRLSNFTEDARHPAMASSGRVFVFESQDDPLALNPDGSDELFLVELGKEGVSAPLQITDGAASTHCSRASLDKKGKLVFFQSDADLLVGGASMGQEHVFRLER